MRKAEPDVVDVEVDEGVPWIEALDEVPKKDRTMSVIERPGHKGVVAVAKRDLAYPVGRVVEGRSLSGVVGVCATDEVPQRFRVALVRQGRDDRTGVGPQRRPGGKCGRSAGAGGGLGEPSCRCLGGSMPARKQACRCSSTFGCRPAVARSARMRR